MKTTENKTIIAIIERLSNTIAARKEIVAEEESLKESVKDILKGFESNILSAGGYIAIVSNRTRTDFDKDKLRALLGEKLKDFEKKSEYQTLEIKKA